MKWDQLTRNYSKEKPKLTETKDEMLARYHRYINQHHTSSNEAERVSLEAIEHLLIVDRAVFTEKNTIKLIRRLQ